MKTWASWKDVKALLVFIVVLGFNGGIYADATTITGAGASFPYPVYSKWAYAYQLEKHININYQSIGSGAGIKQIRAKTVDFGASDKPMSEQALKQDGLMQFPGIIGAVVPVINLEGIQPGELKLTGELLADIFLGKIKKWNDSAIRGLNPKLKLPDQAITVVHRSDASGTTFLMTNYLMKKSSVWQKQVGSDAAVSWPMGLGGKGNEGVSTYIKITPGSIGYVEYAYAKQAHLNMPRLKNKDGYFVLPGLENFQETAFNVDWSKSFDFSLVLTDRPGARSWPVMGVSYILLNTVSTHPEKTKAVLDFFNWAYAQGGPAALELNYVPLPARAVLAVNRAWKTQLKDTRGNAIWSDDAGKKL